MTIKHKVETIDIDGEKYALAPLRAGQMRAMAEGREKNPSMGYMQDNLQCVFCSLNNAGSTYTMEEVEELDYPTYKLLLDTAQRISGFEQPKPGEVAAA